MFGTIMEFMVLALFASLLGGGLILGRKYLQLVHVKSDTEIHRANVQRENIKHDLQVMQHQNQLKLLALTEGTSAAKKADDDTEVVVVKDKDIVEPHIPYKEAVVHHREQALAEDAEYVPVDLYKVR